MIDAFVERAAVASTSTRTVGARTTPGDAYLTIGAGNRTTSVTWPGGDAGAVLIAVRGHRDGTAAEVYQRRTDVPPTGRLLGLDWARVEVRNDELLYGSVARCMGEALADAGIRRRRRRERGRRPSTVRPQRQAALAAARRERPGATGGGRPDAC